MDMMALVLSFVAGGLVACLTIFWMFARSAPNIDGDIIEQMRRETDEAEQVDGGLLMREGKKSLH
ncbi:hypothetical protein [Aerobium aerolatum]|uniref:Uncharacterized protein n=1 Tax=Aquamicrobium aerolatum DSM 21857 TaxID=1121003 RepID=A0A1I3L8Z7_9HYPH|nr:hypothetical protein [Aquamicrobium aerolatum]SFI81201.1 hypothetical protein SAMN03080618_01431 [Aquamicrobium aerolatum DSM 21857]